MGTIKSLLAILISTTCLVGCSVTTPIDVTDNEIGPKVGKSSYTVILGIPPVNGNAGIKTAAENGNIDKISTVDRKITSNIFVTTVTTVVTGK
jgi:hypothetical protein